MRKILILLLFFVLLNPIFSADKELPKISWQEEVEIPEAKDTGMVRAVDDPSGVYFEWRPAIDYSRSTRGAALLDCQITPDKSRLIVLEEIGSPEVLRGTRLVVFDIEKEKVTSAKTNLREAMVRMVQLPKHPRRILVQVKGKKKSVLKIVNYQTGKTLDASNAFEGEVTAMEVVGSQAFVKLADSKNLYIYDIADLTLAPHIVKMSDEGGLIFSDKSGQMLQVVRGKATYFKIKEGFASWGESISLPYNLEPTMGVIAGDLMTGILLSNDRGNGALISMGRAQSLRDRCGDAGVWSAENRHFVLNAMLNDDIAIMGLDEARDEFKSMKIARLKPITNGDIRWLFALSPSAILVVDHRSNIYRFDIVNKRFRKTLIRENN